MTSRSRNVWLKELASRSPAAIALYGQIMTVRARWARARGNRGEAIEHVLRAWRARGTEKMGGARLEWARRLIRECTGGTDAPIASNRLLADFVRSDEARKDRRDFAAFPLDHIVRMKGPRSNDDPERQGDLIILKAPKGGEPGVILIKYSEAIRRFAALFDIGAVARHYQIVLEPSWWGYQDSTFLLYHGKDVDTLVMAPWRPDHEFVHDLDSNLVPLRLGAGDWVDPDTFKPLGSSERRYDLVMVSSWNPVKRHATLFRTLADIRRLHRRSLKVALIGYAQNWTSRNIEALARRFGVSEQLSIFDSIPHAEVARIVADSRAYVLLSLREGANKALYESLFCDTPVVVYRGHRGVNVEQITTDVGELVRDDADLADAILRVLDPRIARHPRAWAVKNTGWPRATQTLNTTLREVLARRGIAWTRDIVAKKNAPNLRYAEPGRYKEFDAAYASLSEYLIPAD